MLLKKISGQNWIHLAARIHAGDDSADHRWDVKVWQHSAYGPVRFWTKTTWLQLQRDGVLALNTVFFFATNDGKCSIFSP